MSAPETQKFQRRTVLIKRSLQLKYVGLVFLSVLIASVIVGGDIYYSMTRIILSENPSLAATLTQFNTIIVVKIALYLVIMLLISLYVSHRFAGPIYRFEKSAQVVSEGDLTHRVSLRTGDELMELQEEFNGMLSSLQALLQKDRDSAARLSQRLAALGQKLAAADPSLKAELEAVALEMKSLLTSFKV